MRALLLTLLAGCADGRGVLVVTVVPDGLVSGVDHLHARVDNQGQTAVADLPLPPGDLSQQEFALAYDRDRRGAFTLTVEAVTAGGATVSQASKDGTLGPSRRVDITVVLPGVGAVRPDLSGVDLAGADLAGVDFAVAAPPDLAGTDLAGGVIVGFSALEMFAGKSGGEGHVDNVGSFARFSLPGQMGSDGNGHFFILDAGDLRRVDASNGKVTTLLTGQNFSALATMGGGSVFLAHFNEIVAYETATGKLTSVAGNANMPGFKDGPLADALFDGPDALRFDPMGHLWVADTGNNRVREIDIAMNRVAGIGDIGALTKPQSLEIVGKNIYVGDALGVVLIDMTAGATTRLAGYTTTGFSDGVGAIARFNNVGGIYADTADTLLLRDTDNLRLRILTLSTKSVSSFGITLGHDPFAEGAQPFVVDGTRLFTSDGPSLVSLQLPLTPSPIPSVLAGQAPRTGVTGGPAAQSRFNAPRAVVADGSGHLFVADGGNFVIRRVDLASGQIDVFAGSGTRGTSDGSSSAAQFDALGCLAADANFLWVCEGHGAAGSLRRISFASAQVDTPIHFDLTIGELSGVASDGNNLYIAEVGAGLANGGVHRVTISSGAVAPLGAAFQRPGGLALDGNLLYVSDTKDCTIHSIDVTTGDTALVAGSGQSGTDDGIAGTAQFGFGVFERAPLAADGSGHLFVAERDDDLLVHLGRVRVIELATRRVTTLAGTAGEQGVLPGALPGALNGPAGIAATPQGLFVSDETENLLWLIH